MSLLKEGTGRSIAMASWEGKIIKADGTEVDLGVLAFHHRNPLKRWAWQISQWLRGRTAGRISGA